MRLPISAAGAVIGPITPMLIGPITRSAPVPLLLLPALSPEDGQREAGGEHWLRPPARRTAMPCDWLLRTRRLIDGRTAAARTHRCADLGLKVCLDLIVGPPLRGGRVRSQPHDAVQVGPEHELGVGSAQAE